MIILKAYNLKWRSLMLRLAFRKVCRKDEGIKEGAFQIMLTSFHCDTWDHWMGLASFQFQQSLMISCY